MKIKIITLEKEIREVKKYIKKEQSAGGNATYHYLRKLQKEVREIYLAHTLYKQKVNIKDISVKLILDRNLEYVSKNKIYIEPDIEKIKELVRSTREEYLKIKNGEFGYECLYCEEINEIFEVKTKVSFEGKVEVETENSEALAILLLKEVVFLNSPWWKKEWPKEARETVGVHVNCNDVFAWGVADAETINYKEIDELFDYYIKDNLWGPSVWCILKRGIYPQKPVYDSIQKLGIWDLDKMDLKDGYNGNCKD